MPLFASLFQSPSAAAQLHKRLADAGFVDMDDASKTSRRANKFAPKHLSRKSTFKPSASQRAERLLRGLAANDTEAKVLFTFIDQLIRDLSRSAEPLRALINLSRLRDAINDGHDFLSLLASDKKTRLRLCQLMSFSQAVAETLINEPDLLGILQAPIIPPTRAELRTYLREFTVSGADEKSKFALISRFRHRETLRIAIYDMELATWRRVAEFNAVVRWISNLAASCVQEVWHHLSEGRKLPFTVIAMGKLGARELNYSSDIDLIFLHDAPEEQVAELESLAQRLIKVLSGGEAGNPIWRVDMRLRPEGKTGALVTNLGYALSYYESFAAPWEWQAQIKSRGIAGDAIIAHRFRRFIRGVIWAKRDGDEHLQDMMAMKRRSEEELTEADAQNVKNGMGGIRDAEWVVQQLQMMVGAQHSSARSAATLKAMDHLHALGVLTESEAHSLREGYLFLRVVEHRLQLLDERAVRIIPQDGAALAGLARRMGSHLRGNAAARWFQEEYGRVRHEVRTLCEHLFWGWHGLELLGEWDVDLRPFYALATDASKRLARMSEGTASAPFPTALARQIKIALGPVLSQLDAAADPERALINLERLCDVSGNRLSLLRSLESSESLGRAVCTLLGGSDALSDTLVRFPEMLDIAARRGQFAEGVTWESARADCRAYCLAFRDHEAALRRWMAREMLRVGLRDLVIEVSPLQICREISYLAGAALEFSTIELQHRLRPYSDWLAFGVLGMGKLGGAEMHYSSDADVLFAHDKFARFSDSADIAEQWAAGVMRYLGELTSAGKVLEVDPRLRPEGRHGALAPSVETYCHYFENNLSIWERQALTRARPVAGDAEVAAHLMAAIRKVAFPKVWQKEWGDELRHIKDRVEKERGPADKSTFDVKLGTGTLSDIEWCAQWLALKYGAAHPQLQTANTWDQLQAARRVKVLLPEKADALTGAYLFFRRAELRRQIVHRRSEQAVARNSRDFTTWARSLFPGQSQDISCEMFEEAWNNHSGAVREIFLHIKNSL